MARPDERAAVASPEEVGLFAFSLFSKLEGAVTAAMVHLGDRLGLYRVLAEADEPLTTDELAVRAGLHERWVREWAYNQGAARLVVLDADERCSLTPEAVAVLAVPDHPAFGMGSFHHLPETIGALEALPEVFRTGIGLDYDAFGPGCAEGVARGFEPWYRNHLVPTVLPALDGLVERLETGVEVIDVGCGAGGAAQLIAEAFPASRVRGYDISLHALEQAEARRAEAGLTNLSFHDPRVDPPPADRSVALALTLDCIHDMAHPEPVIDGLRRALADDGAWLLVDIKARPTYAENVERNPMASMMYGISVLTCLSSSMSEPGGAGLGTLGLPPERAEAMAADAGFTRFRRLEVDHPVNAFYEIRP
ncbi:MAG: class I SAM-dependent methyltransferase [Actinomycetota bacterium]